MARTRKVETSEILDAAERVIVRLGAVGLSIDAVAQEAGISKSRVVYDYKTKAALIEAMIDRQLDQERLHIAKTVQEHAHTPHPDLFARIKLAERIPDELDMAICMAVNASMANDAAIHAKMQDWVKSELGSMNNGDRPRAAYMAHMALVGFCCHEWLGLFKWTDEERHNAIRDVRKIYASFPEDAGK